MPFIYQLNNRIATPSPSIHLNRDCKQCWWDDWITMYYMYYRPLIPPTLWFTSHPAHLFKFTELPFITRPMISRPCRVSSPLIFHHLILSCAGSPILVSAEIVLCELLHTLSCIYIFIIQNIGFETMICIVSYFLCVLFLTKSNFWVVQSQNIIGHQKKEKKAMYIWIIYYYKVSIRYQFQSCHLYINRKNYTLKIFIVY